MRWNQKLECCVRSTSAHILAQPVDDERLLKEWHQIIRDCPGDWSGVVGQQVFWAERPGEHEGRDEEEDLDHQVEVEVETL